MNLKLHRVQRSVRHGGRHQDRITVGSDTWVPQRGDEYGRILDFDRHWPGELPENVAAKIAYANAVKLFGASPRQVGK